MASDYGCLLHTVHAGTTSVLATSEQVTAVAAAARQLAAEHHRRLSSQWELPKLLSATLRTQLNARVTAPASVTSVDLCALCDVLAAAWQLCPIPSLPSPCAPRIAEARHGTAASVASLLPLSDSRAARVAQELAELPDTQAPSASPSQQQPAALPSARDTAVAVVTSLLLYWQALADGDSNGFADVSLTVWRCVQAWTDFGGPAGGALRHTLHIAWLAAVLRHALRASDSDATHARDAVDLLEAVAQLDGGKAAASTPSTVPGPAVQAMWVELHLRTCRLAVVDLRTRQAALHTAWRRTVAPALTRAFAVEPQRLSSSFTTPIAFQEPLEDGLRELLRVADTEVARSSGAADGGGLALLLRLAPLSAWLAGAVGLRVVPFPTTAAYRAHLEPVVTTMLRWGRTVEALVLLDGAAAVLDTRSARWRQRLRDASVSHDAAKSAALTSSRAVGGGGLSYGAWLAELQCTAATALDVLAGCNGVQQLQPVCDALLLVWPEGHAAAWVQGALQDPLTPPVLLAGLARLVEGLLHHRDAPQARFYVTLMGRLLPRCPCPAQLRVLLGLVHRLAVALTTMGLTPADFAAPGSRHAAALAEWGRLRAALEAAGGASGACKLPLLRGVTTTGVAWAERHRLHQRCAERGCTAAHAPFTTTPAAALGSVVELTYATADTAAAGEEEAAGLLWVRRAWGSDAPAPPFAVCCEVGGALRRCAAAMTDVMARNRAQLLHGSSAVVAGEAGRGVDSRGPGARDECEVWAAGALCDCLTPPQLEREQEQRRCKEAWWRDRFALDEAVRDVALRMESAMGAARLLLLGRPSAPLCHRLQTLATDLAATCVRLRRASRCPPLAALEAVFLHVFAAAPYLSVDEDRASPAPARPPACLYGSGGLLDGCATCTRTVKGVQRRLLATFASLGQQMSAADTAAARPVAAETAVRQAELWLGLLLDADVEAAVEGVVPAVLDAFFREAAPDVRGLDLRPPPSHSVEDAGHLHRDLLVLPREHVYLILDGELHALPWEGTGVCQERSVSRLPHRAYAAPPHRTASAVSCSPVVSVRRVVLHRDLEARQTTSALDAHLAKHPEWEVAYGETRHAATAAATATTTRTADGRGDVAAPTALMRRLLAGDSAAEAHIDTYVYAGHKGGEHLVPSGALCDWLPPHGGASAALVLLMGCSSARMSGSALSDSFGLPYAYLSAGAGCVLGCLWDVTDADIDRLTARFLDLLDAAAACAAGTGGTAATVGEFLAVARRACKLRYLTAAATVCYGPNCRVSRPC